MRYEELSLPLAGGQFRLRFHPRLTVLAGLTAKDRTGLVDALAAATAGQVTGGTLVYSDPSGRRIVVRDGQARYLDDGSEVAAAPLRTLGDAADLRSLLTVDPAELGLPRSLDDPERQALEAELRQTRKALGQATADMDRARATTDRRRAVIDELERIEADLARAAGPTEQAQHDRAQSLVELERIRAALDAVNAPTSAIASDEQFLAAADEVHALAEEWSDAVDQLDELLVRFRDRPRVPRSQAEQLSSVPDHAPEGLAATMGAYESASARCEQLEGDLEELTGTPKGTSSDVQVMALGTIDQETLWMAQRRVLLATEQLEVARRAASQAGVPNTDLLADVEAASKANHEAQQRVERLWLSGMLVVSLLVCSSLLLLVTNLYRFMVPPLLVAAVLAAIWLLYLPRRAMRRAKGHLDAALAEAGATDLGALRHRFVEDSPDSAAWRQADVIVDEYESAMEAWNELVGGMTAQEVGALEDEIHAHVQAYDPNQRSARGHVLGRNLEHARADLEQASDELSELLEPYGLQLDDLPVAIGAAVHERIQHGRTARLQLQLEAAEEDERKVARRLEEFLGRIGFTDGSLEARIGALGWAIDEARRRTALRELGHEPDALAREEARLEAQVAAGSDLVGPATSPSDVTLPAVAGPATEAEQQARHRRREELRAELAALTPVDLAELQRQHDQLSRRMASLGLDLGLPSSTIDLDTDGRLVSTLVRLRPNWPGTPGDPMPALLDEPFGGVPADALNGVLSLLVEVGDATQVVLLTGDPAVVAWARGEADRGVLSLLEPSPETV